MFADYLPALRAYDRALRGRNHVLKRDATISWRQAEAFAQVLAEHGGVLRQRREQLCERLREPVKTFAMQLSGGAEEMEVLFAGSPPGGLSLVEALRDRREEEARLRTTVCGPHRDDLELRLKGRDATIYASEGQQRTVALALKLAQARVLFEQRGQAPLLLLDDVFGELDVERRRAFLACLPLGTQKILTTTRLDWVADHGAIGRIFEVEAASLQGRSERS
jgi:DNA replication and repair protein RecF